MTALKNMSIVLMIVLAHLMVFCFATLAAGQCKAEEATFTPIPAPVRARLIERLHLRSLYLRTMQWDKLFDLFFEPRGTKEEFVRENTDSIISPRYVSLDFIPKKVGPESTFSKDTYLIEGCAKIRFNGKVSIEYDIVRAHLINNEWYFSSFGEVAPNRLCVR